MFRNVIREGGNWYDDVPFRIEFSSQGSNLSFLRHEEIKSSVDIFLNEQKKKKDSLLLHLLIFSPRGTITFYLRLIELLAVCLSSKKLELTSGIIKDENIRNINEAI